jgi:uncharacterized protein (TIGR00255 family)
MVRSMTGFSEAQAVSAEFSLRVNIKSLNHRYLDVQVRVPLGFEFLEQVVRRAIKEHVRRGHVEVNVSFERNGASELPMNRKLLAKYVEACRELRDEYHLATEPDLVSMLRLPGVVGVQENLLSPEELDQVNVALNASLTKGFEALNTMREQEGQALQQDVRMRLDRLSQWSEEVAGHAAQASECMQKKLEQRVLEFRATVDLDRGRLAQEVTYLASRSDITEEVTRFRSHLDQARRLVSEGKEVGKKLDFLLQEMNREANTMLSKTTDVPEVGPELNRLAIDMKVEIEKLREQAQNIE